jgi:hypothetical protein
MNTRNCAKLKGELGNYSTKEKNIFDPNFDDAFRAFNIKPQQINTRYPALQLAGN